MTQLKVTGHLRIPAVDIAVEIEERVGHILKPQPEGLFIFGQIEPAMEVGKVYYRKEFQRVVGHWNEDMQRVIEIKVGIDDPIISDVYNQDGVVVIRAAQKKLLSRKAPLPTRGLEVITVIVDYLVSNHFVQGKSQFSTMEEAIASVIHPEARMQYLRSSDHIVATGNRAQYFNVTVPLGMIQEICDDIIQRITAFLGEDKWVMCFHRSEGEHISIEKTIDFRIYDWMRRTNSGEWTA